MLGPLDQGFWPDGLYTAPTDEALKSDIEVTKQLGFNFIRKHVKVEPARWYYWCDRLGVAVFQDMPSGDQHAPELSKKKPEIKRTTASTSDFDAELKDLIDSRRQFACIVAWVPFNEGWGQFETVRILNLTKQLDPTRLVDGASGGNHFPVGGPGDAANAPTITVRRTEVPQARRPQAGNGPLGQRVAEGIDAGLGQRRRREDKAGQHGRDEAHGSGHDHPPRWTSSSGGKT